MAKAKVSTSSNTKRTRPALTPDAREKQMIAMAMDAAEQQLRDGTASSQVITHFLKLGSMRERLERERLEEENKLLRAKAKAIDNDEQMKVDYKKVIAALRTYNGQDALDEPGESYDEY